ncbi:GDSL-type esterase/lipase family protein [Eggerthella lenta]|uniref:GDSL-type esterase/lipase family protein n=1 Tax=Eggerthella lenta TaxID=84112 RepID=UPI0032C1CE54
MNHGNGRHQAERTGKRIAYRLSLVLNIVLVVGILAFGAVKVAPKIMAMGGGGCDYHSNHYYYYDFTSQYDQAVRIDKADICFVGDSLTQLGLWSEFFPGRTVINRGIGSDVSEGVLNRLDSVVDHRPDIVFLMIGVNDLGKGIPEAETVGNVRKIVSSLSASLSDATMVIQSVLPAKGIAEDAILRFNEDYKQIASELRPRRISGSPSPLSCRRGAQRLPLFGRRSSPR